MCYVVRSKSLTCRSLVPGQIQACSDTIFQVTPSVEGNAFLSGRWIGSTVEGVSVALMSSTVSGGVTSPDTKNGGIEALGKKQSDAPGESAGVRSATRSERHAE